MAATPYWQLLKDPRWQRKRLEALNTAGWECSNCSDGVHSLNVHHKIYRKGSDPWDYSDTELAVLCEQCHKQQHEIKNGLTEALAMLDCSETTQVEGFAQGLALAGVLDSVEVKSYEHARGIGSAFGLSAQEIINIKDENNRVDFGGICGFVEQKKQSIGGRHLRKNI